MSTAIEGGDFTESFDRDASNYDATVHALDMLNDRKLLTGEMCAEAIEEGEVDDVDVSDKGNRCITLLHKWGAIHYEVVIDVEDKNIVTICDRGR